MFTPKWNRIGSVLVTMLLVAIFGFVMAPGAFANGWNQRTTVTFSGPVEIPGQVLPAGTYVFKVVDLDRHFVQIFDQYERHLYATVSSIPELRSEPTGKTVMHFEERAAGSPQAIKTWFYPGEQTGREFIYSHKRIG